MIVKNSVQDSNAPRRANLVDLDDHDRAVLGIMDPQEERAASDVRFDELTAGYRKRGFTFADAQSRAAVTLGKLRPTRAQTVATTPPLTLRLPPVRASEVLAAAPQPTPHAQRTNLLRLCGMNFDDAQCLAVALADAPSDAFNPARDAQYVDESKRQAYLGVVLTLTAILQAPLGRARNAAIAALSNANTAWCQLWATRVLGTLSDEVLTYDQARQRAEDLVAELQRQSGKSFLGPTGITAPSDAVTPSSVATGVATATDHRQAMIDASQASMARRHAGRR